MSLTAPPAPVLTVELAMDGPSTTVRLRGALHAGSLAALEAQIDQLGCTPCTQVAFDLSELTELDAVGAGLLKGLGHYVEARGGRFRFNGARPAVAAALAHPDAG